MAVLSFKFHRIGFREIEIYSYGTKGYMRISNAVASTVVELHITGNAELHSPKKNLKGKIFIRILQLNR